MFENCSQVILKVTKDCNLRCTYCYVKDKDHYKGQTMSFVTFKQLIQRIIADYRKSITHPHNIQIVFHGGEPTLLGKSEFQRFINYARAVLPHISFGIQTNLTNIDKEWLAFFVKNNVSLGISLDGITSRDNELRKQGYSFKKALSLLQKYQVKPGILSIISIKNYKHFSKTLYNVLHYTKQRKNAVVRANYVEDITRPELSDYEVSGKDLYTYVYRPLLKKALQALTPPPESNLKAIINKFAESLLTETSPAQSNSNCYTKFCRAGNTIVEVEPTGEVNSCGRWDKIRAISTIGNITKPDIWGLSSLRVALHLQTLKIIDIRKKNCDHCPAAAICDYGCIAFSYIKYDGQVQIREEISCALYIRLHQLLLANRYRVILLSAKQRELKIRENQDAYIISLPVESNIKSDFKAEGIHIKNDPAEIVISRKNMRGYTNV